MSNKDDELLDFDPAGQDLGLFDDAPDFNSPRWPAFCRPPLYNN